MQPNAWWASALHQLPKQISIKCVSCGVHSRNQQTENVSPETGNSTVLTKTAMQSHSEGGFAALDEPVMQCHSEGGFAVLVVEAFVVPALLALGFEVDGVLDVCGQVNVIKAF